MSDFARCAGGVEDWRGPARSSSEGAVSRLSKTASATLAALVVSGAAAVAPLLGPSVAAGSGAGTPSGAPSSPSADAERRRGPGGSPSSAPASGSPDQASGLLPTGAGRPAGNGRAVLFIGDDQSLRPPGGSQASFACRAASLLQRRCSVARRVPSAATVAKQWPDAKKRPDVVVLVMTAKDDARSLDADLDALPASLRGARTAILAPMTRVKAVTSRLPGVRALAAARGVELVDPVDLRWVTPATRSTDLGADGVLPTPAGVARLGERLALALTSLGA
jgi:hypothetical protein